MSPALLLTLLGGLLLLPRAAPLTCQRGVHQQVLNTSQQFFTWTAGEEVCPDSSYGCQDTLLLLENGPLVSVVLSKGCTQAPDQEKQVIHHRPGPGLSLYSFTHVCREDGCNDLSSTLPVWAPIPAPDLGSVKCPTFLCVQRNCLTASELTCPSGTTHCYGGTLQIKGGLVSASLRVQGCATHAGCNLLNGTQAIGPLVLNESCQSNAPLVCHESEGLQFSIGSHVESQAFKWEASEGTLCGIGEVCQETLLLTTTGNHSALIGYKGCSKDRPHDSKVTLHSMPPGVLMASYSRFCSSNWCNNGSDISELLSGLPPPGIPVPGDLQCPTCVTVLGFCVSPRDIHCPNGTTHCYEGTTVLRGGRYSAKLHVRGCLAQPSLLSGTQKIGAFSMQELSEEELSDYEYSEDELSAGAAPVRYLTGVMGLGLSLALWSERFCPAC